MSALFLKQPRENRREVKRHFPGRLSPCLVQKPGEDGKVDASLFDISPKGIALITSKEYLIGALLKVLIVNGSHTFALSVEMTVVRCAHLLNGQYLIGGPFTRYLTHDEMMPFMV
jgi:hypothetical protein